MIYMNTDSKKPAKKQGLLFRDVFPRIMFILGFIVFNIAMVVGLQAIDTGLGEIGVLKLAWKALVMSFVEFICILEAVMLHMNKVVPIIICVAGYILTQHFSLVSRFFSFIVGLFGQGGSK